MSPSVARHWNTWDGSRPAAMVHLPTGLTVRLSAYSAKAATYDPLLAGESIELHEHTSDGDYVRLRARVADSEVEVEFAKAPTGELVGRARMLRAGEWALRFWLCLEIGHTPVQHGPPAVPQRPATVSLVRPDDAYAHGPSVVVQHRSTWHCLVTDSPPVFAGGYDAIDDLKSELEENGYYAPHGDRGEGPWAVLRFNGQANAEFTFAVGSGNDRPTADSQARGVLGDADGILTDRRASAMSGSEEFRAIRDVVAWNTIWDVPNARPMTVLTRNWLSGKFGGWGVWLDDVLFHALLAGYAGDWETAYANLDAALTTVGAAGNLPCLRTAYEEWVDRSQPPIAGYVLEQLFGLTGDRHLLTKFLPVVVRSHDWWFEARDGNGDGLLEFGSSPTGSGAFVHTKQAALDEAAMDNLPAFDEAAFDPTVHTLDMAEPALNSLLAQEAEALEAMLRVVGAHDDARRIGDRGRRLAEKIRSELWDPQRGVFAGRRWNGDFAKSLAPTSFYPWLADAADEGQTRQMLAVLLDEEQFWGQRVLPASTFDDPASADLVYWRGRVWPPLVFWVWEGLRRAGEHGVAELVLDRSWEMFASGWDRRRCYENFHPADAEQDASPDSDPFYSWGALIPLMKVMSKAQSTPREGRVFAPREGEEAVLREPGKRWSALRRNGDVQVSLNGDPVLRVGTPSPVRLQHSTRHLLLSLDAAPEPVEVRIAGARSDGLAYVRCDGVDVAPNDTEDGCSVVMPPHSRTLEVVRSGGSMEQPC